MRRGTLLVLLPTSPATSQETRQTLPRRSVASSKACSKSAIVHRVIVTEKMRVRRNGRHVPICAEKRASAPQFASSASCVNHLIVLLLVMLLGSTYESSVWFSSRHKPHCGSAHVESTSRARFLQMSLSALVGVGEVAPPASVGAVRLSVKGPSPQRRATIL